MRLKSVKNIAKITKSMKMIASTKLARAQRSMDGARHFGETSSGGWNTDRSTRDLIAVTSLRPLSHHPPVAITSLRPLSHHPPFHCVHCHITTSVGISSLRTPPTTYFTHLAAFKFIEPKAAEGATKTLLVACSSDRGLCGAIHSTVSKPIKAVLRKTPETSTVVVIGDKSKSQLARESRKSIAMSFNGIGKNIPTFVEASSIVDLVLSAKIDFHTAKIYYNGFKSVISYELRLASAFPESSFAASGTCASEE